MRGVAPTRRYGVTLLELAVVLAILGLAAAIVTPAIARPHEDEQALAAAPLIDVLRVARLAASDSGRRVLVMIDPQRLRYVVELDGADVPLWTGTLTLPTGAALTTDALTARFFFDPSGLALGSDSVSLSGHTGDARAILITVDPWTGEPRARAR
jgi:prepilin-type N-terminal cleavage/methylation domain-containing protein